jgi:hypothetical protein
VITALLTATALQVVSLPEATIGTVTVTERQEAIVSDTAATEALVRSYFHDIPIMIEIARCESTFRHYLPDGSVLQGRVDSDDTGVMQINKRYHEERAIELGLNVENINDNMAYARYLYEKQGVQPWSASAPCWDRSLAFNN